MIQSYQKSYSSNDYIIRAVVGLITMRSPVTGVIKSLSIWGNTSIGTNILNVSVNGVAQFVGAARPIVTGGQIDSTDKTGLSIAVTKGQLISLDVVQVAQSGLSGVVLQVDIDDQLTLVSIPVTVVTASLAGGAVETGVVALGKRFQLSKVVTSHAARIRLYKTAAARTADAARAFGSSSWYGTEHKMITDLNLNVTTGLDWDMSPDAFGGNGDTPIANQVYYSITNNSGVTTPITVVFTAIPTEY